MCTIRTASVPVVLRRISCFHLSYYDGHPQGSPIDEFLLLRQNAVTARELAGKLQNIVTENLTALTALLQGYSVRD